MGRPRHLEGELVTARRGLFWVGDETVSLPQGQFRAGRCSCSRRLRLNRHEAVPDRTHPRGRRSRATDYLGTPDGRPGWATFLLQEGYAVYVVDRPDHGRSPFHPDVLGPMGVRSIELVSRLFTNAASSPGAHPTADLPHPVAGKRRPG